MYHSCSCARIAQVRGPYPNLNSVALIRAKVWCNMFICPKPGTLGACLGEKRPENGRNVGDKTKIAIIFKNRRKIKTQPCSMHARCYDTRSPVKNIRARGRIIFLFFPQPSRARALKIRQINSAILKVPDGALIR